MFKGTKWQQQTDVNYLKLKRGERQRKILWTTKGRTKINAQNYTGPRYSVQSVDYVRQNVQLACANNKILIHCHFCSNLKQKADQILSGRAWIASSNRCTNIASDTSHCHFTHPFLCISLLARNYFIPPPFIWQWIFFSSAIPWFVKVSET